MCTDMAQVEILKNFDRLNEYIFMVSFMKFLLLLFAYFYSVVSFANHCSGEHGQELKIDQNNVTDPRETEVNEINDKKIEPTESINSEDEVGN